MLPQSDTIERNNVSENHNLLVDVQVPGFDDESIEIDVDLLTIGGTLVKNLISGQPITDYISQLSIG